MNPVFRFVFTMYTAFLAVAFNCMGCGDTSPSESAHRDGFKPITVAVDLPPAPPEPPLMTLELSVGERDITLKRKDAAADTPLLWQKEPLSFASEDAAALQAAVRKALAEPPTDCRVVIHAPGSNARHELVVQLINAVRDAGISKFAINLDE